MMKYVTFLRMIRIGYCYSKMIKTDATKRQGSIAPHALIRTGKFILVADFPGIMQIQGLDSWNIKILYHNFPVDCCVCFLSNLYLLVELVLCLFSSCSIDHSL